MIQENELVSLLLAIGIGMFFLGNRRPLTRLPMWQVLIAAYSFLLVGLVLTVAEGFFLNQLLNFLEHLCYGLSAVGIAFWCRQLFCRTRERT